MPDPEAPLSNAKLDAQSDRLRSKAYRVTRSRVAQEPTPEGLNRAIEEAEGYAQLQIGIVESEVEMQAKAGKTPPIACKKGCGYCCHTRVSVRVPELLRVAEYVKEHYDEQQMAGLRQRLADHRKQLLDLTARGEERPPMRCPLLVDFCCSVHPARPMTCRAFNSVDVNACIRTLENWRESHYIPQVLNQVRVTSAVHLGMSEAIRDLGYRHEVVEMPMALEIALDDPTAGDRWMAGEDVFAAARPYAGPQWKQLDEGGSQSPATM